MSYYFLKFVINKHSSSDNHNWLWISRWMLFLPLQVLKVQGWIQKDLILSLILFKYKIFLLVHFKLLIWVNILLLFLRKILLQHNSLFFLSLQYTPTTVSFKMRSSFERVRFSWKLNLFLHSIFTESLFNIIVR